MVRATDGQWALGIGDPTLRGWLTVAAYILVAGLAAHAAWVGMRCPHPSLLPADRTRTVCFWSLVAVLLFLLGLNKQLDLQSWLTQVMRDLAREQGWYEVRRQYQFVFIAAIATAGLVGVFTAAILLRRALFQIGIALLGIGVLGMFVVARAASFHHMDALLHWGPFALNLWAEFGGTALIAINAWAAGRT